MNSFTCQAANTAKEHDRPVSFRNLRQNAETKKLSDDQKRQLVFQAMHKACKGLCDCWCHVQMEPTA